MLHDLQKKLIILPVGERGIMDNGYGWLDAGSNSLFPKSIPLLNALNNPSQSPDYDLQGYISQYGKPDQSRGQHLTDEYKLPNHITFSEDSKYSNEKIRGGKWNKENGRWHFYPSAYNLMVTPREALIEYFRKYEPDAILHL